MDNQEKVDIYDPEYHTYFQLAKELDIEGDLQGFVPKPQLDFSKLTPEEKANVRVTDTAPFAIYRDIVRMIRKDACPRCWLINRACMCDLIRPAFIPAHIHYHFVVHFEEFTRTSNTVKLMVRAVQKAQKIIDEAKDKTVTNDIDTTMTDVVDDYLPNPLPTSCGTAEMLFFGIEAHEDKLEQLLQKHYKNTFILFPSTNPPAITVDQFLERQKLENTIPATKTDGDELSTSTTESNRSDIPDIHVIVIDGTWKQANHIHHRVVDSACAKYNLPIMTYVKIDPGSILKDNKSLFDPLRSQTQPDRCCTLEASVALLKELHCDMKYSGDQLLYNLKALVDSQLSQSAIKPIYDIITPERFETICKTHITRAKGSRTSKVDHESLRYVAMTQLKDFDETNGRGKWAKGEGSRPKWTKDGEKITYDDKEKDEQQEKKQKKQEQGEGQGQGQEKIAENGNTAENEDEDENKKIDKESIPLETDSDGHISKKRKTDE